MGKYRSEPALNSPYTLYKKAAAAPTAASEFSFGQSLIIRQNPSANTPFAQNKTIRHSTSCIIPMPVLSGKSGARHSSTEKNAAAVSFFALTSFDITNFNFFIAFYPPFTKTVDKQSAMI